MKKIFTLIFALVFAFSGLFVASAFADDFVKEIEPDENGIVLTEEPTEDYSNCAVARLFVCVQIRFVGHMWIYVENLSDESITVGCYECSAGEGVSVGTQFIKRAQGPGIYYNVESYLNSESDNNSVKYMCMDLTRDELEKVNKKILEVNEWGLFTNCCWFAAKVWNSVSDRPVVYMVLPHFTWLFMSQDSTPMNVYKPSKDQVFRQRGFGDSASLDNISDLSLLLPIG